MSSSLLLNLILPCLLFNDTTTTEIYTYLHTLSLHDALPISPLSVTRPTPSTWLIFSAIRVLTRFCTSVSGKVSEVIAIVSRSEEHTSELQSLMRISYAVFCLKKKLSRNIPINTTHHTPE